MTHDELPGWKAVSLIAQHEFIVRVRGKVFSIGTAVIVALIAIFVVLQLTVIDRIDMTQRYRVGFTSQASSLAPALTSAARGLNADIVASTVAPSAGEVAVRDGSLDALIEGDPNRPAVVVRTRLNTTLGTALLTVVRQQALDSELRGAGLSPLQVRQAVDSAGYQVAVLQPLQASAVEAPSIGAAIALLLYVFVAIYGSLVAQSVASEKASRVVEVLLSTVRPTALLIGKVVGVGLAAVLQFGVILVAALALTLPTHVLAVPASAVTAVLAGLGWFVLGYLLYGTLLAAVASLVSRVEEVQVATVPVTLLLVAAWLMAYAVFIPDISAAATGAPVSAGLTNLATVASLIPFFSPVLMPIRIAAGQIPLWQGLLGVLLTVAAVGLAARVGGRIYLNSVLRFGARVRLLDALR